MSHRYIVYTRGACDIWNFLGTTIIEWNGTDYSMWWSGSMVWTAVCLWKDRQKIAERTSFIPRSWMNPRSGTFRSCQFSVFEVPWYEIKTPSTLPHNICFYRFFEFINRPCSCCLDCWLTAALPVQNVLFPALFIALVYITLTGNQQ